MAGYRLPYALTVLLISAAVIGCSENSGGSVRKAPSPNINDVAVAVFEYQIEFLGSVRQRVVFLQVDDHDPAQEVMAVFEGGTFENSEGAEMSVKRFSKSEWIPPPDSQCGRPVDIETGVPGTVFNVASNLNWMSDTTVTVWGGYITSCTGGTLGTFTLEWIGGSWVVEYFTAEGAF